MKFGIIVIILFKTFNLWVYWSDFLWNSDLILSLWNFNRKGLTVLLSLYLNSSRTVAVILVANLALADFLFSLCSKIQLKVKFNLVDFTIRNKLNKIKCTMPLWIAEILYDSAWIFGSFLCKFGTFTTMINFYGSTFFLVAISIDRYIAIVHPLKVEDNYKKSLFYSYWFKGLRGFFEKFTSLSDW